MGRDSLYKRGYHAKEAIKLGKQGFTIAQIASRFDVTRKVIYDWIERYDEFKNAMELSRTHAQAFNEQLLHEIAVGTYPDAKPAAFIFKMKSQHKDDYADVRYVKTDSNITVNNLNDDQLNRQIAAQIKMLPAEERRALLPQLGNVIEMEIIDQDEDQDDAREDESA